MTYVDALQTTLAAEHAAVHVVGYLGAQTSQSAQPVLHLALSEAYLAHRSRRDLLVARVRDEGAAPEVAEAAYALPEVGGDPILIKQSARDVESGCATTYAFLVASSPSDRRRLGIDLLLDASVRGLAFGASPETYPGR